MPKFSVEVFIPDRHFFTVETHTEDEAKELTVQVCTEQEDSFGSTFNSSTGFTAQHCELVQE